MEQSSQKHKDSPGMRPSSLPGLLYVADIAVESSYHGSALIYRLLQGYPADRLFIVTTSLQTSLPERRLPNVRYCRLPIGPKRLLRTRFSDWYATWLLLRARMRCGHVRRLLNGFRPQAILTVTHDYSWITADELARQYNVP